MNNELDSKNIIARNIVANLGRRYLRHKHRLSNYDFSKLDDTKIEIISYNLYSKLTESWNSFESSRRILNGFDL